MKFLAEISKPEYQANLPFHITYGPDQQESLRDDHRTERANRIACLRIPKMSLMMLPVSLDFYAKHRTEALELYMEMMSE